MKAKLEFDLPEEQVEFNLAVNGSSWAHVAWCIDQELRGKIKYSENITEEQRDTYQEIRDILHRVMNEQNVDWE